MKQKMSRFGWCALFLIMACGAVAAAETKKKRVFIVSSYNKAYIWSQSTQKGVSAAMQRPGTPYAAQRHLLLLT